MILCRAQCAGLFRVVAAAEMGKQVIGAGDGRPSPFAPFGTSNQSSLLHLPVALQLCIAETVPRCSKNHTQRRSRQSDRNVITHFWRSMPQHQIYWFTSWRFPVDILPEVKGGSVGSQLGHLDISLARLQLNVVQNSMSLRDSSRPTRRGV